ncbi:bifunctional serine/threonine-protein kinase/ABC transporter substrate-binding protein [Streptomyces sp. Go-475]|uniref:bifunctional serine/threonine-protein kinase/ABC transporter substrate-binding protein n=1 Tax=Streptomyces sp. Go-475 TaxID=2072505 RepID=UPI000DF08757|nr:bifunctional serine/threonine-protein kinase/ABC transporter substrate-binding protein [Streptomyces sp. Go-475]AXE84133.1 Serine/threonine-protein kinase AfsK [Streptomyces sp. Go-475]
MERRLGAGGMGVVYLARTAAGRQVALKVIRPEYADEPHFRARFRREVAAARRVSGAFTAPVVDADPDGDPPWLATQYVAGDSLEARVRSGGPLPVAEVVRLAGQLAEALRDIHRQGIVHRDLKPANVLLADDGVRVIDFGIARSAVQSRALTRSGAMVGTPAFMAPEQLVAARAVSPATDVFALGGVLAFAASGRSPFEDPEAAGLEPIAVAFAVVHQEPDLTGVPAPLRALVSRCLAKDPAGRPGLEEVLRLATGPAQGLGEVDGVRVRPRRRPGRAAIAALAVLATLFLTGDVPPSTPSAVLPCAEGLTALGEGRMRRCVGLLDADASPARLRSSSSRAVAPVLERIAAENRRVVAAAAEPGGRPFVSMVYLTPITQEFDGSGAMEAVRRDLEGAHLAQLRTNGRLGARQDGPAVRLLFGHTGGTAEQRNHAVGQVLGARRAQRIVAALGLGGSTAASQDMVEELTAGGLPAFGSVLTADSWAAVPGLARVAPTNADQAAAAVQHLSAGALARARILFVQDVAPGDQYTSTLAQQFRARIPAERLVRAEPTLFDSSRSGAGDFRARLADVCAVRPDVVYFAGRGTTLPRLLTVLAARPCKDHRITVMSGDDTMMVRHTNGFGARDLADVLGKGRIDLLHTGLAHPRAWEVAPEAFDLKLAAPFRDGTFTDTFGHGDLEDGRAVMMYDALLTAARAVRETPAVPRPSVTDVHRTLARLREKGPLPGASGWIALGGDGAPKDKAIPVLRIAPDGRTTAVTVTSADGRPTRG